MKKIMRIRLFVYFYVYFFKLPSGWPDVSCKFLIKSIFVLFTCVYSLITRSVMFGFDFLILFYFFIVTFS